MLSKDKLVFDTSVTLSENDNVGAFMRSSDGTLITHTTVGGDQALDVNIAQIVGVSTAAGLGIFPEDSAHASGDAGQAILVVRSDAGGSLVSADGDYSPLQVDSSGRLRVLADLSAAFDFVYDEDTAHVSGSPGAFVMGVRNDTDAATTSADGDYSAFSVDSAGRMKVVASVTLNSEYAEDSAFASGNIGNYVLSVRQDTLATDTSADGDYASFKVNSLGALYTAPVGNVADDAADSGNPIKIGSRAESGALSAVADGDRADLLSDSFRRIYVNSGANIGIEETAVTVTTTATALPGTALVGRRTLLIQNLSNQEIYIGGSGVTTANGIRLSGGGSWEGEVGDDVGLFGIKGSGTADVRVLELA